MNDIRLLEPDTRERVEKMLHFLDQEKIPYRVIETKRSESIQRAFYAQGREPLAVVNIKRRAAGLAEINESDNKRKITWTLKSKHIDGRAADIVPVIDGKIPWSITTKEIAAAYMRIGMAGEAAGLSWGGRWTPLDKFGIGKDAPHFEEI